MNCFGTFPAQKPYYDTTFVFVDDGWNNYNVPTWAIKPVLQRKEEDKDEIDCEEYSLFNNNRIILQTLKKRLRILTGKKITDII